MTLRERVRVAVRLQAAWQQGQRQQHDEMESVTKRISPYYRRVCSAECQVRTAHNNNLVHAQSLWRERLASAVRTCRIVMQDLEGNSVPQDYSLRNFYDDLLQLEEEFPSIRIDWEHSLLIVVTDAVELQGINLGPFSLRLSWTDWIQYRNSQAIHVIADEPQAAALHDDITHPHVREGELCTGDAQVSLQKALEQGRLADAFLLIRSVLTNYNAASAYVSLEQWEGQACNNCGDIVNDDNRSYCEGCHQDYCFTCSSSCSDCGDSQCSGCLDSCASCEAHCCPGCLSTTVQDESVCSSCRVICPGCHQTVRTGDLDRDTGLCSDCFILQETTHESLSTASST